MTDDWFNFSDPYSPTTWNYWADNHPKSKTQYDRQQFIKRIPIIGSFYSDWLTSKDSAEKNQKLMDLYGLDFGDIDYPHSSALLNSDPNRAVANATWQFSKNLTRLYGD